MSRAGVSIGEGMLYCREFFDLQYSFAELIHRSFGRSLEDALFEYTNLYVRFGIGRNFDAGHEKWRATRKRTAALELREFYRMARGGNLTAEDGAGPS
jgi:hypothetical protein